MSESYAAAVVLAFTAGLGLMAIFFMPILISILLLAAGGTFVYSYMYPSISSGSNEVVHAAGEKRDEKVEETEVRSGTRYINIHVHHVHVESSRSSCEREPLGLTLKFVDVARVLHCSRLGILSLHS